MSRFKNLKKLNPKTDREKECRASDETLRVYTRIRFSSRFPLNVLIVSSPPLQVTIALKKFARAGLQSVRELPDP